MLPCHFPISVWFTGTVFSKTGDSLLESLRHVDYHIEKLSPSLINADHLCVCVVRLTILILLTFNKTNKCRLESR